MWPHIILPLPEANHATEDISRMNANTHVDVDSSGVSDLPVDSTETPWCIVLTFCKQDQKLKDDLLRQIQH